MKTVSIIIPCCNEEKYLKKCIDSILAQSYKHFELIIVDDGSKDNSQEIIKSYTDKRISCIRSEKSYGGGEARNKGIKVAKGELLFFTDADCVADKNWLKNGITFFKNNKYIGIEGRLYYVSKNHKSTLSDQLTVDLKTTGHWMSGDVAYKREAFDKVGLFDSRFVYHQDRELALRVQKYGKMGYCEDMIVTHMEKKWSFKGFFKNTRRIIYKIKIYQKYGDKGFDMMGRIVNPVNIIKIIIPPLAYVGPIMRGKFRTWDDIKLFPLVYIKLIYERILIWKTAIKNKIFLI